MRNINETMWATWESGEFVGNNRPVTRATIQKARIIERANFRTLSFMQDQPHYEIPNIKTVVIDRRLSTDAASLTLTFANLEAPIEGENLDEPYDGTTYGADGMYAAPTRRDLKDLGRPGLYSYRRGSAASRDKWGFDYDPIWADMFIPNRVVRTFQGYGTDGAPAPADDTNLVMTGMWLIDRVEYKTQGTITLHCRDTAKLLIEQRLYPPIVPLDRYIAEGGLRFCADYVETTAPVTDPPPVGEVVGDNVATHPASAPDSSNDWYYGYDGSVYGHKPSHVFDGDGSTYWLSVGSSGPTQPWAFPWVEADTKGEPVNRVRFNQKWGGYIVYIGIREGGEWQGSDVVPYDPTTPPARGVQADRPYVLKMNSPAGDGWVEIDLDRTYNADAVRITLHDLPDSGLGPYPYRGAIYGMEAMNVTPAESSEPTPFIGEDDGIVKGNISDYTDIIKVLCALSGFWWPNVDGTLQNDNVLWAWAGDGDQFPFFDVGRVWGDFFYSGAYPVEPPCIPPSFWDNKSVMDGINQIKEILGFIFYVDSTGGVVWRMPNIWKTGNFITGTGYVGQDSVREISEEQVLLDYGVQVDDTNLRSQIVVVSADDPTLHRAIQPGWAGGSVNEPPSAVNPLGDLLLLGGQERLLLVPNYPFISQEEVDKFAYLVSLWIHWSYRKSQFRVPGNPAFEPDDQVRIYERVTAESYIHYIQGVRSTMDMDTGTYYCDMETHWLGNGPDEEWVVNTYADMPPALFAYLVKIGQIDVDGVIGDLPPDWDPTFVIPDFPPDVPRLDQDLDTLFPDPPAIDYADIDDTWSDEDIANAYGDGVTGTGGVYHRSEAWRIAYWGNPSSTPRTSFTFVKKWSSGWSGLPLADQLAIRTFPGQTSSRSTTVPVAAKRAYELLAEILMDEGVNIFSCGAFAGVNRKIANTNTLSAHAWGLAIDLNPSVFDCCSTPRSVIAGRTDGADLLRAGERIVNTIRTNNGNRVFGWGGKWSSKKDWMHFEIIVTPGDLASGVHR